MSDQKKFAVSICLMVCHVTMLLHFT